MTSATEPVGRRERNKRAKLERITAAASELFATHGVDEVTTQQIADAADIGTGTLFLYAKSKGELLLLVQNARYAEALERGRASAAREANALDAVMAVLEPVVECNRVQVENGRTYLREMLFGDSAEPHHAEALSIAERTEWALEDLLIQHLAPRPGWAKAVARVISAILFLAMASAEHERSTVAEILDAVREQLGAVLPR